jgi:outer membrane murein-binding lipoprotein Lpp
MSKLFLSFTEHLSTIRLAFAGCPIESKSNLDEMDKISADVMDLNIYTWATDRENLRRDRNNIANDLKKAITEREMEISK